MMKLPMKQAVTYLALAVLFLWVFNCMSKPSVSAYSTRKRAALKPKRKLRYAAGPKGAPLGDAPADNAADSAGVMGMDVSSVDGMYAPAELANSNMDLQTSCAAANGVGLASSLLPREAASQDNFGEFAPDDILKGQSFLSPRDQVGMPETIGGSLRNANQQIRAEPPNPKKPYVWQNSTIAPDTMQRPLV